MRISDWSSDVCSSDLTVVLLFGFQGRTIVAQPFVILLIAAPPLVHSYGVFAISYAWAWAWRIPFAVAAPAALIGGTNFRSEGGPAGKECVSTCRSRGWPVL